MTIRETARPIEDTEVVAWAPSAGVTLYDKIAEEVADDAGYINSTATTNNSKFKLSPLTETVGGDTSIVISYRVKASDATDLSVQLLEGSTVIAERLHVDIPSAGYVELRMTLTEEELNRITNAANLYINFIAEHFVSALLLEDSSRILLEDGGVLLIERNT